jgi:hypothetical protein
LKGIIMPHWTVECSYAAYHSKTVTVEAETLEAALESAITKADDEQGWDLTDAYGESFIATVGQGDDLDLWGADFTMQRPVPIRFTERGPCVYITIALEAGLIGDVQIANGPATVEIRDYDIQGIAADRLALDAQHRLCVVSIITDPSRRDTDNQHSELPRPSEGPENAARPFGA